MTPAIFLICSAIRSHNGPSVEPELSRIKQGSVSPYLEYIWEIVAEEDIELPGAALLYLLIVDNLFGIACKFRLFMVS
jgi:hypothetical protein